VQVYVNGVEAGRVNIAAALPLGTTVTSAKVDVPTLSSTVKITVPLSTFKPGSNVIAVELHQEGVTTVDAIFDLSISMAIAPTPSVTPTVSVTPSQSGSNGATPSPTRTSSKSVTPSKAPLVPPLQTFPFKSLWRYNDRGLDLGKAWFVPSFNDSSWKSGPAVLGACRVQGAVCHARGPHCRTRSGHVNVHATVLLCRLWRH
jgi:hypothetical protein